ncbi:hypothetical protein VTN77DRAFT_6276 [Rasamsonia byssochlamydoides]|uniref:uncharacterized protein n=1 Tax=Rasamsonia byssochlamydoides TaxID=89139 RepID=UPI003744260B
MTDQETSALAKQFNDSFAAFQAGNAEDDRVQALKAAQRLVAALEKPEDAAYKLAYSPTQALAVRVGVDLEFFETLTRKDGPTTLEELAAPKGADPILAERFLRLLVGIGYVGESGKRVYVPTAMTKILTERRIIAMTRFIFDYGMLSVAKLPEYLRLNNYKNPFSARGGPWQFAEKTDDTLWEFLSKTPIAMQECNTFLEGSRGSRTSWLEWFPVQERIIDGFEGGDDAVLLVDVAGGRGHEIGAFKSKFPDAPGRLVLEDLAHVIDDVQSLDPSIERVKIDLFEGQPVRAARNYYLKLILHDWSDDDCRIILNNIKAAMKKGYSKLIVEDFILPDQDCSLLQSMWDCIMMLFLSSMERSADQWTQLFESVGLKVTKFWYPPGEAQGIIEVEYS